MECKEESKYTRMDGGVLSVMIWLTRILPRSSASKWDYPTTMHPLTLLSNMELDQFTLIMSNVLVKKRALWNAQ